MLESSPAFVRKSILWLSTAVFAVTGAIFFSLILFLNYPMNDGMILICIVMIGSFMLTYLCDDRYFVLGEA